MDAPAIVLDTNVFIAAGFNPQSASAKILNAVRERKFRNIWNEATRRETEATLKRIPPLRSLDISDAFRPADCVSLSETFESFTEIPDPADREFARLAFSANAILISNDDHLLGYRGPALLSVFTPSGFLRAINLHL